MTVTFMTVNIEINTKLKQFTNDFFAGGTYATVWRAAANMINIIYIIVQYSVYDFINCYRISIFIF